MIDETYIDGLFRSAATVCPDPTGQIAGPLAALGVLPSQRQAWCAARLAAAAQEAGTPELRSRAQAYLTRLAGPASDGD